MTALFRRLAALPDSYVFGLLLLLCIPAFFYQLGLMPFIGDEAIRAVVALEMKLSGNYILPTINGDVYLNKPPLYNWFLLLGFRLFGYFGETPSRVVTLFFLFAYAGAVYIFTRRHFDRLTAFTAAAMLLTGGRILFWDSMLGLIDICFSFVVYANWMLLYHYGSKGQWYRAFIASYLLAALGFLLKGLPAAVFQIISIPVAILLLKFPSNFFKPERHPEGNASEPSAALKPGTFLGVVFSLPHLLGFFCGFSLVAAYYALFARYESLDLAFRILLDQSLRRTATHHGLGKTILHLFTFPFEQLYHFLPWSLLLGFVFHPKFWRWLRENDFVRFNFWMMLANLPVYWASVEVYPRYLLMFVPAFNLAFFYALQRAATGSNPEKNSENPVAAPLPKAVFFTTLTLSAAAALLFWITPVFAQLRALSGFVIFWIICSLLLTFAAFAMGYDRRRALLWLAVSLLVFRFGFNGTVMRTRNEAIESRLTRADIKRLAGRWGGQNWFIYDRTEPHQVAKFYLTRDLNRIVRRAQTSGDSNAVFLVDPVQYPGLKGQVLDSMTAETGKRIILMKF